MKKSVKLFSAVLAGMLLASCTEKGYEVSEWVKSERDNYWQIQDANVQLTADSIVNVNIDLNQTAQTIDGFGTCFNELGWQSLSALKDNEISDIFAEMFQPGKGANFIMGRMGIGANDFAIDWYSFDETEGDFELKDFTIDHDRATIIPMIKKAMEYYPDLKIWGSPWCPPRWMKKNGTYCENPVTQEMVDQFNAFMAKRKEEAEKQIKPGEAGSVSATSGFFSQGPLAFRMERKVNDGIVGKEGHENVTSFIMEPEYLDAYARYFGKYVDAYRAEGINVFMVMPQNEMNSAQNFPSCCWTSEDLNTFVGKYLGPEMEKRGVDVYYGTVERPDPLKVDTLLNDPDSKKYIKGVSFQWAGKDALPTIYKEHPDLKLVQSEQECGNGLNNWEGALHAWDLMKHYLGNGINSYFYWNTSLFDNVSSTWGWFQNSLVTVNKEDNSWTYTPDYYTLKHASHYVLPGAKYVNLGDQYNDMMAFVNTDGSVVVMAGNQSEKVVSLQINLEGKSHELKLSPESINTFVLKK